MFRIVCLFDELPKRTRSSLFQRQPACIWVPKGCVACPLEEKVGTDPAIRSSCTVWNCNARGGRSSSDASFFVDFAGGVRLLHRARALCWTSWVQLDFAAVKHSVCSAQYVRFWSAHPNARCMSLLEPPMISVTNELDMKRTKCWVNISRAQRSVLLCHMKRSVFHRLCAPTFKPLLPMVKFVVVGTAQFYPEMFDRRHSPWRTHQVPICCLHDLRWWCTKFWICRVNKVHGSMQGAVCFPVERPPSIKTKTCLFVTLLLLPVHSLNLLATLSHVDLVPASTCWSACSLPLRSLPVHFSNVFICEADASDWCACLSHISRSNDVADFAIKCLETMFGIWKFIFCSVCNTTLKCEAWNLFDFLVETSAQLFCSKRCKYFLIGMTWWSRSCSCNLCSPQNTFCTVFHGFHEQYFISHSDFNQQPGIHGNVNVLWCKAGAPWADPPKYWKQDALGVKGRGRFLLDIEVFDFACIVAKSIWRKTVVNYTPLLFYTLTLCVINASTTRFFKATGTVVPKSLSQCPCVDARCARGARLKKKNSGWTGRFGSFLMPAPGILWTPRSFSTFDDRVLALQKWFLWNRPLVEKIVVLLIEKESSL